MADYRDVYPGLRAAGASVAAVSVDAPEKSEVVRRGLGLPFPILSDTERRVVREWGILNAREKGGIAKPAVFILAPGRFVRFVSVDEVESRVPAAEILRRVSQQDAGASARRKMIFPSPATWFRAVRNMIRMGIVQKKG